MSDEEKQFGLDIFHEAFIGGADAAGHSRDGRFAVASFRRGTLFLNNQKVKGQDMMQRTLDTVADAAQQFLNLCR